MPKKSYDTATLPRHFCRHLKKLWEHEKQPPKRLLIAVSGGVDSIALLHLMVNCQKKLGLKLAIGHFHHGLRAESDAEATAIEQLAEQLNLPCFIDHWQPPTDGYNLPARARHARYHALHNQAQQFAAQLICTAHHQDDQVETFFERLLLRGSGVRGLGGIRSVAPIPLGPEKQSTIQLFRPLLDQPKQQLVQWLEAQQIPWFEDASNLDQRYTRSKLRHTLIPYLEQEITQQPIAKRMAETATRLQEADEALEWTLNEQWTKLQIEPIEPKGLQLNVEHLLLWPKELQSRTLDRLIMQLCGGSPLSARAKSGFSYHLNNLGKSWRIRIRGVEVIRDENRLCFRPTNEPPRKRSESNH
uniref:tRNA(Ile)-lysidine synthase n=1 Tax=Magnetococcus massalia (strain MO-1) TaxID=451514 RepID=A0A1S7LLZ6_MAGMO|nr:tRNA(Ile)-lysidine synthetase [Candidatus Magnetococcus massalia]